MSCGVRHSESCDDGYGELEEEECEREMCRRHAAAMTASRPLDLFGQAAGLLRRDAKCKARFSNIIFASKAR